MIPFLPALLLLSSGHPVCNTYMPKIKDKIKAIQNGVINILTSKLYTSLCFIKYLKLSAVKKLLLPSSEVFIS